MSSPDPGRVVLEPPALHVGCRDHGPRRFQRPSGDGAPPRTGRSAVGPARPRRGPLAAAGVAGSGGGHPAAGQRGARPATGGSLPTMPWRSVFPPEWNRNPDNGALLPMSYGKKMSFRDTADRRHQVFVGAQPSPGTGVSCPGLAGHQRPRYLEGIGTLLESWFVQNPICSGQLGERAGGRHPPDQLGDRLAADRRPASPLFEHPVGRCCVPIGSTASGVTRSSSAGHLSRIHRPTTT